MTRETALNLGRYEKVTNALKVIQRCKVALHRCCHWSAGSAPGCGTLSSQHGSSSHPRASLGSLNDRASLSLRAQFNHVGPGWFCPFPLYAWLSLLTAGVADQPRLQNSQRLSQHSLPPKSYQASNWVRSPSPYTKPSWRFCFSDQTQLIWRISPSLVFPPWLLLRD